jgi:methylenetetrahydrofolate dehydrogenase (NADP+)/methenyltetrahydrofolate cyclohydrolase
MGQKIDGTALAHNHEEKLIQRIKEQKARQGESYRIPTVVSFCNEDDPPSVKYTVMKFHKAFDVGIDFMAETFNAASDPKELIVLIDKYNQDPEINGIMVQLPLPHDMNPFKQELLEKIDPKKDVDGLTEAGCAHFMPATVKAVISILEEEVGDWKAKKVGVVGSEGEVGKPLVRVMSEEFGVETVIEVDKDKGNIDQDLKECDIVISCTGQEGLITPEMIKDGVVLIDVGLGDFTEDCYDKAALYTGKTGGVGPMTVISLMENVVESAYSK